METDEQQILQLFEDGDRALIAADVDELSRIFADDYVQYDECGRSSEKKDVIVNLGWQNTLRFDDLHRPQGVSAE